MSDNSENVDDQDDVHEPTGTGPDLSEDEIINNLLTSSTVKLQQLIPSGPVRSASLIKVACWILTSNCKKRAIATINQRIKWLTSVVQYGIVDSTEDLQKLFNPLIQLIFIGQYHASVCHLLYLIATPKIHKFQVERITKSVKVLGLTKPLAGLLGRLKSMRPDLVPQTIPYQSTAISFPKAPASIRNGFYALSEKIREQNEHPNGSLNEDNRRRVSKKMRLDLIPRIQHINLKSSFEVDFQKMILLPQFKTFDALVNKITQIEMPNHVGSLLSKREYHYVLSLNFTSSVEALLSRWIFITLWHEFMEKDQTSGKEGKTLLLKNIIEFQQSTGRKLLAVYDFLPGYLKQWDGVQYCDQIFQLIADIPCTDQEELSYHYLTVLDELFRGTDTPYRLKIIQLFRRLIYNMLLDKLGPRESAGGKFSPSDSISAEVSSADLDQIGEVIRFSVRLLNMALTSSTDASWTLISLSFYSWLIEVEAEFGLPFRTVCQPISVYSALFSAAPVAITLLCRLFCKYDELGAARLEKPHPDFVKLYEDTLEDSARIEKYVADTFNCLVYQKAFSHENGYLLRKIPQQYVDELNALGSINLVFDIKRHPAFTGTARTWLKSKYGEGVNLFKEMDADATDEYIRYLFGCFPAIKEFILRFHKKGINT